MDNTFINAMKIVEEARNGKPVKFSISIEADENTKLLDTEAQIEIQGPANALCAMAIGSIVNVLAINLAEAIKQNDFTQEEADYTWSKMNADLMKYTHSLFAMEGEGLDVKLNCKLKEVKNPMIKEMLRKLF